MTRLTVLTHNVFWFQGAPFPSDRPGEPIPGVMESLAGIYRALAADVLCLQEIQDRGSFRALRRSLGLDGGFTPGGALRQYGGAALWERASLVRDSGSCQSPPQRMWQMVVASAGEAAPIRVCNIHLPSSRQLGKAAGEQRLRELAEAIESGRRPAIVAGDFNELPGGSASDYMADQGYVDAAVLAGQAFRPTGLGGRRGDYIWLDEPLSAGLVDYGVLAAESMRAGAGGEQYLSDHFPLWVTLEVGRPRK